MLIIVNNLVVANIISVHCALYSVVWEEDIGKSLSPSPNIFSIGWEGISRDVCSDILNSYIIPSIDVD